MAPGSPSSRWRSRRAGLLAAAGAVVALSAGTHGWGARIRTAPASAVESAGLRAPSGFRVSIFASGLGAPRALALDPAGTLLVSNPSRGRVLALPDRHGRGAADGVVVVADHLDLPHGLAVHGQALYVAETGRIVRFRYDPATLTARDPAIVVPDLPHGGHHWTRSVAIGPDGTLYVAVGSSCDVCRERDARRGSIMRYGADGSAPRVFATGLRNPVGLAFEPDGSRLWTTVNERDWSSGGAPADYITEVRPGATYGWPDCFAARGKLLPDPEFAGHGRCAGVTAPTLEIAPHSAPLGLAFYTGRQFPPAFHGRLFVAFHGSRAGLLPAGYKVVAVTLDRGRPTAVDDFLTGFRSDDRVRGRPVDVVTGADGSLLVSDDHAGVIHRVTYEP